MSLLGLTLVALMCCHGATGLMDPLFGGFSPKADLHVIRLYQEKSPVFVAGEEHVVAFRSTYLANLRVGNPAQEFNIMFDTGSGQVIVPHVNCTTEQCQRHLRYDMADSRLGHYVHLNGTRKDMALYESKPEIVTIGFGVGEVRGEVVMEEVCQVSETDSMPCGNVSIIAATQLSVNPFLSFPFDGIVGMGLPVLSLTPEFNFFQAMRRAGYLRENMFSLYLSEAGDGSELALGGINHAQLASEVHWANVVMAHQGHWQVDIIGFHVGNLTLDICKEGGCRGVVDSGTSHIAIPSPHEAGPFQMLSQPADSISIDCRYFPAFPPIIVELPHFNLTLYPEDYMRQLPVPENIQLGAGRTNQTNMEGDRDEENQEDDGDRPPTPRICRPRIVGVSMPPEIGSKTFILGQSIMHRYVTVFNFDGPAVGFGLAAGRTEGKDTEVQEFKRKIHKQEEDDVTSLMATPPHMIRQGGKMSTTTTSTTLGPLLGEGLVEHTLDRLRKEEEEERQRMPLDTRPQYA